MTPENVEDVKEVTVNGQTVDLGDVFDEGTIEGEVKEIEDDSSEPK
jgi:predicted RNA-binding protein